MSNLQRLQEWFWAHSSDWQNDYHVTIVTTSDPGWWVTVDFNKYTSLAKKEFKPVFHGVLTGNEVDVKSWIDKQTETYKITKLQDGSIYATLEDD